MNNLTPPPKPVDELIGFRVECYDEDGGCRSMHSMDDEGDILPAAYPVQGLFWEQADDHLSWKHVGTPFVSFFRSWGKAMNWKASRINLGGRDIHIVAVWLKGLTNVYDAYEIAHRLGYPSLSTGGPGIRRRLENHEDELLVKGGIDGSSYRVLACFNGDTLIKETATFSPFANLPDKVFHAKIPRGSLSTASGVTATESLRDEMNSLTGVRNDFKFYILVLQMSRRKFTWEEKSDGSFIVSEISTVFNNGTVSQKISRPVRFVWR